MSDTDHFEFAKLPMVTDLESDLRKQVVTLLESLDRIALAKGTILDQEDDIKNQLQQLQRKANRSGFRYGLLCFVSQSVAGRKSLDKGLLLEAGISATTLKECYKAGTPSTRNTFKRLPEEK